MYYLYVKTHSLTGLKYLGKTTKTDYHTYPGSGTYWKKHLLRYGNDYTTVLLYSTENKDDLAQQGLYYSELYNVVKSKDWANVKPENGDGGDMSMLPNWREIISKRDMSGEKNGMYGRSAITEQNLKWYTNGDTTIYVTEGTEPMGFRSGRSNMKRDPHSIETKRKISKTLSRKCMSPSGEIFSSRIEAAKAYGISPPAIGGLIKRGISGWKCLE